MQQVYAFAGEGVSCVLQTSPGAFEQGAHQQNPNTCLQNQQMDTSTQRPLCLSCAEY